MDDAKLKQAIALINTLSIDLRAEVVISELIESSFSHDEIRTFFEGAFRRPFRKDIVNAKEVHLKDAGKELELRLSRNGLYDSLPEGVFHQPNTESMQSSRSFSSTYKARKKEEDSARAFFQPIENEFLRQRVNLEAKERGLLTRIYQLFDDFLLQFWKIDVSLPPHLLMKLLKLLPSAHRIAGDLDLVSENLSSILGEYVAYSLSYVEVKADTASKPLGQNKLGQNLIIGGVTPYCRKVIFEIGPIHSKRLPQYLKGGEIDKFLSVFYSYFLPLEFEYETKVKCRKTSNPLGEESVRLGYSLSI